MFKRLFVDNQYPSCVEKALPLVVLSFFFQASRVKISQGTLQSWTKGFDVLNVKGNNVVPQLMAQIEKRNIPIKVTALNNMA